MSSSLRRGILAATALALAVATLSACAAGDDAQTLEVKPDNAATSVNHVKLQNVNLLTPPSGSGPVAVTARIFNNGSKDETLRKITVKGTGVRVKLSPAKGRKTLTVPAGGSLALGGKGNASAVLTGARPMSVKAGNAQQVGFELSRTGHVGLRATVVPTTGEYSKYGPTVQPSPSTSPGSPSGSPSSSSSASSSTGPSDTASPSGSATSQGSATQGARAHTAGSPSSKSAGR